MDFTICGKLRWEILSKISGLFSGKSYNLDSLTVGTTEDPTISRMTIATVSDDETFEQIKKQLNVWWRLLRLLILQIFCQNEGNPVCKSAQMHAGK